MKIVGYSNWVSVHFWYSITCRFVLVFLDKKWNPTMRAASPKIDKLQSADEENVLLRDHPQLHSHIQM